jgi:hypothetical protein
MSRVRRGGRVRRVRGIRGRMTQDAFRRHATEGRREEGEVATLLSVQVEQ